MSDLPTLDSVSFVGEDDINRWKSMISGLDIVFSLYHTYPEHLDENGNLILSNKYEYDNEDDDEDDEDDDDIDPVVHDPRIITYVKTVLIEFCERFYEQSVENFMYGSLIEDKVFNDNGEDVDGDWVNHKHRWSTYEMLTYIFLYHSNTPTEFEGRWNDMTQLHSEIRASIVFRNNTRLALNEFIKHFYGVGVIEFINNNQFR